MKRFQAAFQILSFKETSIPLALLLVAVLGFGILAPRLGYYHDDWPHIYYAFNKGIPALAEELYYDNRPNATWLYIGAFHLLGFTPVAWHLAALVLRWLTVTVFWYFLRLLWPERTREISFVALIFVVHPFFLIQPYAVNSILYWGGYLLFGMSLWLMAASVKIKRFQLPLSLLALFLEAVHLFTSEYFVGIVLIRPIVLYWLTGSQLSWHARLKRTLAAWSPYAGVLGLYGLWRLFFYVPPIGDRNTPEVLYNLLRQPLQTILSLIPIVLQDSIIVTITGWYRTLSADLFAFQTISSIFVFLIVLLVLVGILIFLSRVRWSTVEIEIPGRKWIRQALFLGISILILGLLPIWMIGENIVNHKNPFAGTRYGIVSTLGASIILVVMIEGLVDDPRKKALAASAFVALAIGAHLNNELSFARAWEKQVRFYRQLSWRAPEVQSGTAFVTDMEILGYMGQYPTSFGINTIYQPGNLNHPRYWYFPLYYTYSDLGEYADGIEIHDSKMSVEFTGYSRDSLVISFDPELDRCLWILSPEDEHLRLISEDMRRLSTVSAIQRIGENNGVELILPEEIFGKPGNQGWCYYFEKADLARQYQQWDEVVRLWDLASAQQEGPGNGYEYIPFIEGLAHAGDWATVKQLTKSANLISKGLQPSLCNALDRIQRDTPADGERDQTITDLKEVLDCRNYQ